MFSIRVISLFILFSYNFFCNAQDAFPKDIFITTEIPNSFIYGDDSFVNYIKNNFNVCKNSKKEETIVMKFLIEPDSTQSNLIFITDTNVLIKGDIVEMFNYLPKWKPGIQSGVGVRSLRLLLLKCANGMVVLPPYETPK